MRVLEKIIDLVGALALLAAPLIVVVVGSIVMLYAWSDLTETNATVAAILQKASGQTQSPHETGAERPTETQKAYLERLEASGRNALSANTISFLFQIFAVCLVSAGAYVLLRLERQSRDVQKKVNRILRGSELVGEFVKDAPYVSSLGIVVLNALHVSGQISILPQGVDKTGHLALARQLAHEIRGLLAEGKREGRGFSRSFQDILVDELTTICDNLRRTANEEPLVKEYEACLDELRGGPYVKTYEDRLRLLQEGTAAGA